MRVKQLVSSQVFRNSGERLVLSVHMVTVRHVARTVKVFFYMTFGIKMPTRLFFYNNSISPASSYLLAQPSPFVLLNLT